MIEENIKPIPAHLRRSFPDTKKREVKELLHKLCPMDSKGAYQHAHIVRRLGFSTSYVSSILNAKEVTIDKNCVKIGAGAWLNMYRSLLDYANNNHASTRGFKLVQEVCATMQDYSQARRLRGFCGSGKTEGIRYFCKYNDQSYHIECRTGMKPAAFLRALLEELGETKVPNNIDRMLAIAIQRLQEMERPLVVVDDVYYLTDRAMLIIKDLVDATRGYCGWLLTGEESMEKRLERGVEYAKPGYEALKDRTGRLAIEMPKLSTEDKRVFIEYKELNRPDLQNWLVTNARTYRDLRGWVDVLKRNPDDFRTEADLDEIFLNKYSR